MKRQRHLLVCAATISISLCISFNLQSTEKSGRIFGPGPSHPGTIGKSAAKATQTLKVAVAQPMVIPGDLVMNTKNMAPLVTEAAKRGAELVVFSECGITGYDLKGIGARAAIPLEAPILNDIAKLARSHDITIVAGFHERLGDKIYISAAVFYPDGRRIIQRKHTVPGPEKGIPSITPGERKRTLFNIKGFRCAILICSDAGISGIYEELAGAGVNAIILITAGAGN